MARRSASRPAPRLTADWWRLFRSPPLDAMVQQALANNPTLQAAEASLRQSQDNLRAGYGVFYPQVDASLRRHPAAQRAGAAGIPGRGTVYNLVTASGTISYALDVFGGERRTVEGLRAQVDYQRYASKAAYLALSANVVNTSIARAAYAAQIRATEQLIALEQQQLQATEAQVRAGTSPYSSVLSHAQPDRRQPGLARAAAAEDQPDRAPAGNAGRRCPSKAICPTST